MDLLKANMHKDMQNFIEINLDWNFLPCINRPTRITKSSATLIDNTMISQNLQGRQDSKIIIDDLSDHLPSLTTFSGSFLDKRHVLTIKTHKINDEVICAIKTELDSFDWNTELITENVDGSFSKWHDTLKRIIDKHAPEKLIKLNKETTEKRAMDYPYSLKEFH